MSFQGIKHMLSILPALVKVNFIFTCLGNFVGLHKKSHPFFTGGVRGKEVLDMDIYFDRIKPLFDQTGLNVQELGKELGISPRHIYHWNKKETKTYTRYIVQIARYFDVSAEYLLGETDDKTPNRKMMIPPIISNNVVAFPVIGTVAAGYDKPAYENWTGDSIEIPRSYLHGREPNDYFVLRVEGDSMYPNYQNGDHVLVLRQNTLDYSGQVAVVVYDGEDGSLKAVDYTPGSERMTLRPLNTNFPPRHIYGEDMNQVHICGVAKLLIRELDKL